MDYYFIAYDKKRKKEVTPRLIRQDTTNLAWESPPFFYVIAIGDDDFYNKDDALANFAPMISVNRKDIDGKDIHEGHIVKAIIEMTQDYIYNKYLIGYVKYDVERLAFVIESDGWLYSRNGSKRKIYRNDNIYPMADFLEFEIIGNIHDKTIYDDETKTLKMQYYGKE